MGDLVCDGTEFSCPFCTSQLKLKTPSSPATGDSNKLANTNNSLFPPPGGQCTVCPSAPVPCVPSVNLLDPGQSSVHVDGTLALGAGCKFMCAKGGILTVSSPGQSAAKHDEASSPSESSSRLVDIALLILDIALIFLSRGKIKGLKGLRTAKKAVGKSPSKLAPKKLTPSSNSSVPAGSKRSPHVNSPYQKTRNTPTVIQGRSYSGHALDQMQNRGITPNVVENTIKEGTPTVRIRNGVKTTNYYDKTNDITVVVNEKGGVITAGHGKIGK